MTAIHSNVHETQTRGRYALARVEIEAVAGRGNYQVVANLDICGGLYTGIDAVPDNVAFDEIAWLAMGSVQQDAREAGVVNDVIARDDGARARLDLDAVALLRSSRVMDPVSLDQRVADDASGIVATHVHAFAGPGGSVDMVSAHRDIMNIPVEINAHRYIVNLEVCERDV